MKHLAVRPFLDALFAPLPIAPTDDTILCRCEEVTAGRVREAVGLGCLGANQLKSFTRAGMGPCQGRMCASSVAAVIAATRGVPVQEIEPYRLRFPTKPLTLGELVEGIGGGTASGRPVKAVQVGGPLGAYFPPSLFDTCRSVRTKRARRSSSFTGTAANGPTLTPQLPAV